MGWRATAPVLLIAICACGESDQESHEVGVQPDSAISDVSSDDASLRVDGGAVVDGAAADDGSAHVDSAAPADADTGAADTAACDVADAASISPGTPCGKQEGFPRDDDPTPPTFSAQVNISSTIVIDEPGVYDYENVLHIWTGAGSCNQTENQPYVLRIAASGVTLKNFAYQNAPDGIHIGTSSDGQGYDSGRAIDNIVLDNVTGWACEDALTVQKGVQHLTIMNSQFFGNPDERYRDKLLQLNFGDVTIERSTFVDSSTCVMFKGDQTITVRDSTFINCDRGINGDTENGVLGDMGTGPSFLISECNESYFPSRAWQSWGSHRLVTLYANTSGQSVNDLVYDHGYHETSSGGELEISCDAAIESAELCGALQWW